MSPTHATSARNRTPVAFATASFCAAALNGASTNFTRVIFLESLRDGRILLTEDVVQEIEDCFEDAWPQLQSNGFVCEEDSDEIFEAACNLSCLLEDKIAGKEYAVKSSINLMAAARSRCLPVAASDEGHSDFSITSLSQEVGLEIIDMDELVRRLQ